MFTSSFFRLWIKRYQVNLNQHVIMPDNCVLAAMCLCSFVLLSSHKLMQGVEAVHPGTRNDDETSIYQLTSHQPHIDYHLGPLFTLLPYPSA